MGGVLNVDEMMDALESKHRIQMPRMRDRVRAMIKGSHSCKDIKASFIDDCILEETLEAARDTYDSNYEFFYDRRSGLLITGIQWHEDFARELYADIYPDLIQEIGFNQFADHMFEVKKEWGFKSSVSSKFMHKFSLNFNERQYFKRYLSQEY